MRKSHSRALLFKPLISHSHKELWGRFILFTFLLHLVSVILQRCVSYMRERERCPERSQLHSQLYKSPQHAQTMANRPITPPWHTGADKEGTGQWDHRPDKRPFNEVAHKTGQNRAPHLRIPSRRCPHISSCLAATAGTAGERETQRKRGWVREKGEKNDSLLWHC